jgi:hypothetical protein
MDALDHFANAPAILKERESALLEMADFVFTADLAFSGDSMVVMPTCIAS